MSVLFQSDYWILADEEFPLIDTLIIHGGLEFENNATKTFNLRAKYIIIYGRLVVGWAHDPFPGVANIILSGSHSTPVFPVNDGPTLGSKVIGECLVMNDVSVVSTSECLVLRRFKNNVSVNRDYVLFCNIISNLLCLKVDNYYFSD